MKNKMYLFFFLTGLMFSSCVEKSVNLNAVGTDKFAANQIDAMPDSLGLMDTVYVSVYSDIYSETKSTRFNLTATLSLRNTSIDHSIFISDVDYYDSSGKMSKAYLEKPIELLPLQTVEYVIEEVDETGGTGANFIICWGGKNGNVNPLFESIMISTQGQQGISFTSRGVSISRK